jgi:dTDP-4-dehydrorhamnose 3,5-epimerase
VNTLHCTPTALEGVLQVQRQIHADARGSFSRLFCAHELASVGWTGPLVQVNHSVNTARGTVRGMHFQHAPWAERKLVSCVRGRIWDVAVDLRRGSPTFLRWHAQELSAQAGIALLIPQGCAHGFQALSDDAEIIYCHSAAFVPEAQSGVHPCDPRLAITWPLPVQRLSQRDAQWPALAPDFAGVEP